MQLVAVGVEIDYERELVSRKDGCVVGECCRYDVLFVSVSDIDFEHFGLEAHPSVFGKTVCLVGKVFLAAGRKQCCGCKNQ